MTDATNIPPTPGSAIADTVWVWDRNDVGELQKCLLPAASVPPEWLPSLQRRYTRGDRVQYQMHDEAPALPGTIVQDQGEYVALDGDVPGTYATVHKTYVEPLADADRQPDHDPAPDLPPPTGSPHADPDLRRRGRSLTARWTIGPADGHWQRQASLHVDYVPCRYFQAVLRNVEEFEDAGLLHERPAGGAALVVHSVASTRFSQTRLQGTYRQALDVVRRHFDADDPDFLTYFRPTLPVQSPVSN